MKPGVAGPGPAFALGCGVAVLMALVARGWAGDEEIGHLLIARWAPEQPELFLSLAGRPLITVLLSLPAQAGALAARLLGALATGLAAVAVARMVGRAGWGPPLLGVVYFLLQPFLIAHAGTAMSEPFTAALVAWGLVAWSEKRPALLAVCAALLPTARLETVVFWLWLAPFFLQHGHRRWLAVLPLPILAWHLGGVAASGDPLWLWHASGYQPYPPRDVWHYLQSASWIVGWGLLTPMLIGAWPGAEDGPVAARLRAGALAVLATFFGVYTVLASWHPITFGNLRYFAYAAPAVALLVAAGIEAVRTGRRAQWIPGIALAAAGAIWAWPQALFDDFTPMGPWSPLPLIGAGAWLLVAAAPARLRIVAPALALGLAAAGLGLRHADTLHLEHRGEHTAVARIVDAVADRGDDRPLAGAHPLAHWLAGTNPYDTEAPHRLDHPAWREGRAWLLWETHYTAKAAGGLEWEDLAETSVQPVALIVSSDSSWAGALLAREPAAAGADSLAGWNRAMRTVRARVAVAQRALRADPGNPARWRTLAFSLEAAERPAEAEAALARAHDLAPDDPATRVLAAEFEERRGRPDAALDAWTGILETEPKSLLALRRTAAIWLDRDRPDEALPFLQRAVRIAPDDASLQYETGGALFRLKRWDEAAVHLERADALAPRHPQATALRTAVLVRLGRRAEAADVLRARIDRDPLHGRAYELLGDLLALEGREAEARTVWQEGWERTGAAGLRDRLRLP